MSTLIDLSHNVTEGMQTYPGLPVPRYGSVLTRENSRGKYAPGVEFTIGSVELCTNTGTYLDTPFHRYADGHDLAQLPLGACVDLRLVLIEHPTGGAPASLLDGLDVTGAAVVFRTGWSIHWGTDRYFANDHPYVTAECSQRLVDQGAVLVGIDSLNIDGTAGSDRPAHSLLLSAGIPIVEHLTNLDSVPVSGARFTAVPVKMVGLGTFPVRAFATVPSRPTVCEVVVDCYNPRALSAFWAEVVRGQVIVRSDDWATVHEPVPGNLLLAFQRVPESKSVKNRVHLDIWSSDISADTARLVSLGAVANGGIVDDEHGPFQVLTDPEGNEFCLVH